MRSDLRRAEARRDEAREGDRDLPGGEEAIGVGRQRGQSSAAPILLGQTLHLRLAKGHQSQFGGCEEPSEEDEEQHDGDVDP